MKKRKYKVIKNAGNVEYNTAFFNKVASGNSSMSVSESIEQKYIKKENGQCFVSTDGNDWNECSEEEFDEYKKGGYVDITDTDIHTIMQQLNNISDDEEYVDPHKDERYVIYKHYTIRPNYPNTRAMFWTGKGGRYMDRAYAPTFNYYQTKNILAKVNKNSTADDTYYWKAIKAFDESLDEDYVMPSQLYNIEDDTAEFSKEGADWVWWDSEAKHNENYANAYRVKMSPEDFLDLTTRQGSYNLSKGMSLDGIELRDLDIDEFNKEIHQPIFLRIEFTNTTSPYTADVIGHEGRHRMFALLKAGVKKVDVQIRVRSNENYDKYNPHKIDRITLTSQFVPSRKVTISGLVPMSWAEHKKIRPDLEQVKEDLSTKQEDYFKNSKIRDEKGNLIPVYHGSKDRNITVFDPRQAKSQFGEYKFRNAIVNYFTKDRETAKGYTNMGTDEGVYEVYLNIENPYIVNNETASDIKSHSNIKDSTIRDKQLAYFNKIWNKWNSRFITEDDLEEINDDLFPLGFMIKSSMDRKDDTLYDKSDDLYDLYQKEKNIKFGKERIVEYSYTLSELFDDDMYDTIKQDIVGIDEEDYYFTTDDIVKMVLLMNKEDGTNYDGIIIPDISDIGPTGSLFGNITTDYITLKSPNQIKAVSNINPTNSNRINETR